MQILGNIIMFETYEEVEKLRDHTRTILILPTNQGIKVSSIKINEKILYILWSDGDLLSTYVLYELIESIERVLSAINDFILNDFILTNIKEERD